MMPRPALRLAAIGLAALLMLGACASSPPTHYYTLSAAARPPHPVAIAAPVQVAAVHLPDTLDRREMVRETGPNTLAISGTNRWSAPLGVMTRRVLSQDLALHLPGKVILPEAVAPPAASKIVVTIAQFVPRADGRVVLVASWSLLAGAAATPVLRRDVSLSVDRTGTGGEARADAQADAAAMSALLAQLAARIAATLAEASP